MDWEEENMSKEEVTEYLKKKGYDAEVKSGVVTVYYTSEIESVTEQMHTIFDEVGYDMSFALMPGKEGEVYERNSRIYC